MADNRTIAAQAFDGLTGNQSCIVVPEIDNPNSWQIPSYVMNNIVQTNQFHGNDEEDAPAHINRLYRVLKTFKLQGATEDAIFLHLFPFSLTGKAATWLDTQPPGTFTTWEALCSAFIKRYFPPAKASVFRDQIHSFHMEPDEQYCHAWERFQNLLSRCSQNGLTPWALVEKFYNGLNYETQVRFDTATGGSLLARKNMFESFAQSDLAKVPHRGNSKPVSSTSSSARGVHQVNLDTSVAAALESLTREVKKLKAKVDRCEFCRGGHGTLECPVMNQQVDFVAGQNRFPNNYNNNNQSWNTYKNPNQNNSNWSPSGAPPGFQNSYAPAQGQYFNDNNTNNTNVQNNVQDSNGGIGRLEEMMKLIFERDQATQKKFAEHDLLFKNQQSSILDIQRTVGDIARRLEERPPGQFSGIPQTNPAAQLKAISTRSGRVFGPEVVSKEIGKNGDDESVDEEIEVEAPGKSQSTTPIIEPQVEKNTKKKSVGVQPPPHIINHAYVSYPASLKHQQS
ncbi:uncharacterized protein LOC143601581 [Bidens hawaiensis]|uniref:uncharacterized protein LOC143601581 n=1 Tax=Bidens hawaiensis TaxID=980011 RepID=UPI00404B7803